MNRPINNCTQCGARLRGDEVFCENCGIKIMWMPPHEPTPPPIPQKGAEAPASKKTLIIIGILVSLVLVLSIALFSSKLVGDDKYSVTFDPNGGENAPANQRVSTGETVDEPKGVPSLEGYEFSGWYTNQECEYKYDFSTPVNEDLVLYAGWVPMEETSEGLGDLNGAEPESPYSVFVTSKEKSGIYVRKQPYVPKKVDKNKVLYIKKGDTSVRLIFLKETYQDKEGYIWLKVNTYNGIGWVREDVVKPLE